MSAEPTVPHFRSIPLAELRESKANPRRHFNPESLKELTESVRAHGVLTPILARPVNGHFEIAAGHRRFRAAKAADLAEIPAVVRPMGDVEFLEVLVTENLQREDVHPLEEADGYRALMKAGYDVQRIADRVGRSVKYVYDRMKLEELTEDAKKLFFERAFTAGHAILLARLSPADQKKAIKGGASYNGLDGLFTYEETLWDPRGKSERREQSRKAVSVRELQAWIDENIRLDPADPTDRELFPELVGALAAEESKGGRVVHITHEGAPYGQAKPKKDNNPIFWNVDWKPATGKSGEPHCDQTVLGVFVVGPARGQTLDVCIDRKCAVHWKKEKGADGGGKDRGASRTAEQDRWKREDEKRLREEARWKKAAPTIVAAVAEKAKTGGIAGVIAIVLAEAPHLDKASAALLAPGKTAESVLRYLAFARIASRAGHSWERELIRKHAKAIGVDVGKILEAAAAAEKPAAPQTSAKKKRSKK